MADCICYSRKRKSSSIAHVRNSDRARKFGVSLGSITCVMGNLRKLVVCFLVACSVSINENVSVIALHFCLVLFTLMSTIDLKTISKFGQMEYKYGTPERGKSIFEGIVESHPKRWDLWSIYIDMEAGQKEIQSVR